MPEFNPMARVAALCLAGLLTQAPQAARAQAPALDADDIGGIVAGPNGPEAGVWVIAETTDLPTKLAKIVVTDAQGRYLIPDLPAAKYKVWVRGYGLVDGPKAEGTPGQALNLAATPAPNARAAAEAYPGMYWYSMLKIPPASAFPGTGDGPGGNGIPNFMRSQYAWIDTVKQSCQSCHALASQNIRHPKKALGEFPDSYEMWARRIQSGQAMPNMAISIARLGPELGLRNFADWTDRIAKGELPTSQPRRPEGLERNMVVTLWDWSQPEHYLHDAISTDKRKPTLNANGLIYGAPEESTDLVPVLDPVNHRTWNERHPFMPGTPGLADEPLGPSPFWGEKPIWDGHTSNHNLIMDDRGLFWFAARVRAPAAQPAWCKAGGDHPSAKVAPLVVSGRHLSLFDPKTKKWDLIDTCFGTHHLYFGYDADNTLWTSWGPPAGGAIGWLNTRKYLETRDAKASQGWAPLMLEAVEIWARARAAQPDRWLDLGPVDGYRLLPPRPAILPDPLHPRQRSDPYRPDGAVPAAARHLVAARDRCGQQGAGLGDAGQRPSGKLRPRQVPGAADRAEGDHRRTLLRRLDRLSLRRAAIRRRRCLGQCRARLLRLGRSVQYAGARQRCSHRLDQWQ